MVKALTIPGSLTVRESTSGCRNYIAVTTSDAEKIILSAASITTGPGITRVPSLDIM